MKTPSILPGLRKLTARYPFIQAVLIAGLTLLPTPATSNWSDADANGSMDTWVDPATSSSYTLQDLDAISQDIDADGAYNEEEMQYGSNPFVYDTDSDGLNDGDEIHLGIQNGAAFSLTQWDSDGDLVSDFDEFHGFNGVLYSGGLPGFTGATYSDFDGDGIKNPWDPYPEDPTNNDSDGDGIDDANDPSLNDAANTSPYNGVSWYSSALSDDDGDTVLNFWDELPNDGSNGSSDNDGDGILNGTDPFPDDYSNFSSVNSINWYGDVFGDADSDGSLNYLDQWPYDSSNGGGGSGPVDSDGDSIPDDSDPYPSDYANTSGVNGIEWYGDVFGDADSDGTSNHEDAWPYDAANGAGSDTDGDGFEDSNDPYPSDSTNFSATNGINWYGNIYGDDDNDGILNHADSHPYDGSNGGTGETDTDGDSINDSVDPYPNDNTNYSSTNGVTWYGGVLGDDDGDGDPNYSDPYPYDSSNTGGDPDTDGDQIPDSQDPYPSDPANFSSLNGISWYGDVLGDADGDSTANYQDGWPYDSSNGSADSDGDGIPNDADPYPGDHTNYSSINSIAWYGDVFGDVDGDSILNHLDQYPEDEHNGIDYDSDDDGIEDASDPFPEDEANYSIINDIFWLGNVLGDDDGDGVLNHADSWPYDDNDGEATDSDNDGLENSLDPAPSDRTNYSAVNGISWYGSALADGDNDGTINFNDTHPQNPFDGLTDYDGDGLPNSGDPFPRDNTNFSAINNTAWGAECMNDNDGDGLMNWQDSLPNDVYNGVADADGDGFPSAADPYPLDATNSPPGGSIAWYGSWMEDYDGDGVANWIDEYPWEGLTDTDTDGVPDGFDPMPDNGSNPGAGGFEWAGSPLGDADKDMVPNFADEWPYDPYNGQSNSDGDQFDNTIDPAPYDATNFSFANFTEWHGNALEDPDYDGIVNFHDYSPYEGENADCDEDGIYHSGDPYPGDFANFSPINHIKWYGDLFGDADADGVANHADPTPYLADLDRDGLNGNQELLWGTVEGDVDSDDDGLSDGEEVKIFATSPTNKFSKGQAMGWGNTFSDWELVDLSDTDGDDIPDRIEAHYNLNPNWSDDAGFDLDNNGINNRNQYLAGIALDADLNQYDSDEDGMSDVVEDFYQFVKGNPVDALMDADGDGVLNYEEAVLLLSPRNADTTGIGGLGDLQVLMHSVHWTNNSTPPTDDLDEDGIPDWAEALLASPQAPHFFRFSRGTLDDLDLDGMPDEWEHQYALWRYHTGINGLQIRVNDADNDNDGDGLTNIQEYLLGYVPIAGDSDGNGTPDSGEDRDGDGLTDQQELTLGTDFASADTDKDGISDGQELEDATDPLNADSSVLIFIGLQFTSPVE